MNKLLVFSGRANPGLYKSIAKHLGVPLGRTTIKNFEDGEIWVQLEDSPRDKDVFIIQSLCCFEENGIKFSVNDALIELLMLIDAARRASANRIVAVIPYLAYARQEKKTTGRESITAKLVTDFISTSGANHIIALDLHAPAIEGFFDIPVDNLPIYPILAKYFLSLSIPASEIAIASSDAGGMIRADKFRRLFGKSIPLILVIKRRPSPEKVQVEGVIGNPKEKYIILIDDIIATGSTLIRAAEYLVQKGAKQVFACATHPVLCGNAKQDFEKSPIKKVVVANTVPVKLDPNGNKFKIIDVAPLLTRAIRFINQGKSMSKIYQELQ